MGGCQKNKTMQALSTKDGGILWETPVPDIILMRPAVTSDSEKVFAWDYQNKLHAFAAQHGTQLWTVDVGKYGHPSNKLLVHPQDDKTLFVPAAESFEALNTEDASVRWSLKLDLSPVGGFAFGDNVLFIPFAKDQGWAGEAHALHAVDASSGKILWSRLSENERIETAGSGYAIVWSPI